MWSKILQRLLPQKPGLARKFSIYQLISERDRNLTFNYQATITLKIDLGETKTIFSCPSKTITSPKVLSRMTKIKCTSLQAVMTLSSGKRADSMRGNCRQWWEGKRQYQSYRQQEAWRLQIRSKIERDLNSRVVCQFWTKESRIIIIERSFCQR